jgi:hypothetical protein
MPKLSTLSNPTGLIELDKARISIGTADIQGRESYRILNLDLNGLAISTASKLVVIARRKSTELRTDHGPISSVNQAYVDISELVPNGSLRFRVLITESASPKLIASVENISPNGLGSSESFIGMEPADLEQTPWEFEVLQLEGKGIIRFNRDIYPNTGIAEADIHLSALVYPEAVRLLARWHADHPGALDDPQWIGFKDWLVLHGVNDEPEKEWDFEQKAEWSDTVANAFCKMYSIGSMLKTSPEGGLQ